MILNELEKRWIGDTWNYKCPRCLLGSLLQDYDTVTKKKFWRCINCSQEVYLKTPRKKGKSKEHTHE